MSLSNAHIAALGVSLHIPASQSLKEKRRVLKSLKDRIRSQFNISVSEIGEMDKWQKGILGMVMISNDRNYLSGSFESVLSLIERVSEIRIIAHKIEFL